MSPARETVKRVMKRAFASSPGWRLAGPFVRAPGVIVLMYHRILGSDRTMAGVPVGRFAAQLRWVRDHCDPIAPEDLPERVRRPRSSRPAVLVTFDDGYRDYHDLAYPVLKEMGIPAVVFVSTAFLDEGGTIWTEQVRWAARTTRKERVDLPWSSEPAVELRDAAARDALGDRVCRDLKKVPDADRRTALSGLFAALDAPAPAERQMLTWNEVRSTMDITRYGGHSHTHPILSRLARAEAVNEIVTCRDRIAAETGRPPTLFAYPNGGPADYTPETQQILREHGFTVAFSTTEGIAGADTDWMAVHRLPGADVDLPSFVWIASGLMR